MRTSQAAFAIFAAASLQASTAQRKRSSLRESRRRELNEFGNALSFSMSIPEEDFTFDGDASISLSMSADPVPPLGPAGFKWELSPVIVVSADNEKKADKKEKGDKPDKKEKDEKNKSDLAENDAGAEKKEKDDKPKKKEKGAENKSESKESDEKADKMEKDDNEEPAPFTDDSEPEVAAKSGKARKW
jgi:hypothetical protein